MIRTPKEDPPVLYLQTLIVFSWNMRIFPSYWIEDRPSRDIHRYMIPNGRSKPAPGDFPKRTFDEVVWILSLGDLGTTVGSRFVNSTWPHGNRSGATNSWRGPKRWLEGDGCGSWAQVSDEFWMTILGTALLLSWYLPGCWFMPQVPGPASGWDHPKLAFPRGP